MLSFLVFLTIPDAHDAGFLMGGCAAKNALFGAYAPNTKARLSPEVRTDFWNIHECLLKHSWMFTVTFTNVRWNIHECSTKHSRMFEQMFMNVRDVRPFESRSSTACLSVVVRLNLKSWRYVLRISTHKQACFMPQNARNIASTSMKHSVVVADLNCRVLEFVL